MPTVSSSMTKTTVSSEVIAALTDTEEHEPATPEKPFDLCTPERPAPRNTRPSADDGFVQPGRSRNPSHWTMSTFGPADRRSPKARVRHPTSDRPNRSLF
jgi:hypothetical protein